MIFLDPPLPTQIEGVVSDGELIDLVVYPLTPPAKLEILDGIDDD